MRYNEIITESKKASPQAIQAVLNWFKKNIEEHHEDIEYVIDCGNFPDDYQAAFGVSDIADGDAIQAMRVTQWQHAFKSHFGMTDVKYLEKCEAEHEGTIDPRDMKLLHLISNVTTAKTRLKPNGTMEGVSFYMASPQKMVVNAWSTQGVITKAEIESISWTFQDAATWMVEHGAEKLKRPSRPKAGRFSYYD